MNPPTPQRIFGAVRAASGLLFMINPSGIASTWVGSRSNETSVLTRSVGSRDLAIGAGLAITGRPGWMAASIASDLADGLDAAFGDIPEAHRRPVSAWAFGFAALGMIVAFRFRDRG